MAKGDRAEGGRSPPQHDFNIINKAAPKIQVSFPLCPPLSPKRPLLLFVAMALPDVQWPTLLSDWSSRADVLREVRRDGAALAFATSPLRGDREVVEAAVSGGGGLALEFLSKM